MLRATAGILFIRYLPRVSYCTGLIRLHWDYAVWFAIGSKQVKETLEKKLGMEIIVSPIQKCFLTTPHTIICYAKCWEDASEQNKTMCWIFA